QWRGQEDVREASPLGCEARGGCSAASCGDARATHLSPGGGDSEASPRGFTPDPSARSRREASNTLYVSLAPNRGVVSSFAARVLTEAPRKTPNPGMRESTQPVGAAVPCRSEGLVVPCVARAGVRLLGLMVAC